MTNDFRPNTIVENTDCLVAYIPDGRLFAAKRIEGSNLRTLFSSFAFEFTRLQNKIYELSVEDDLAHTTNLLDEWEKALQIPDTCLTNTVSLVQRRKQLVAKFALMNLTTEKDWVDLAFFFGYRIKIEYGTQYSIFTMKFPLYFSGSIKAAKFTMIINFYETEQPKNLFTLTFPIKFENSVQFLMCLFRKLKPANVNLHFRWKT